MHIRPRCREWLPLVTQQLRLRNLISIQGLNIMCANSSSSLIYYTLHQAPESMEIYRSEPLPASQQHQKWAEIACVQMLKSNLNCICVKVWEKFACSKSTHSTHEPRAEQQSALSHQLFSSQRPLEHNSQPPRPPDKLLFTWGVYFSGLIPMLNHVEPLNSLPNSLIFQLNGDYFASPKHLTLNALREQLALNYKRFSGSATSDEASLLDEFSINSPQVSRSSSPVHFAADSNEETNRDFLAMSRARCINVPCSEVRKSYNLQGLLDIQQLQRLCVQKSNETLEIGDEIQQHCVRCITPEQLARKRRTMSSSVAALHNYQHHSMGRALSKLLSEQQPKHEPQTLLRAQKLQQQIESLRSKQRLLQTESDTYAARVTHLRDHLAALSESRQKLQASLQKKQCELVEDNEKLQERLHEMQTQVQTKRFIVQNVERRMSSLCMELREIYLIGSNQLRFYTICGIPFPNMDAYLSDARYVVAQAANITPMALSASLGYIAHLVQMIAVIINRPLRNPIYHEGSRTRIVDIVQDLPYSSREYPLYSRSTIPSKPVKYAIYLLNQNIAQLCYDITGKRVDLRATIENILLIFSTLDNIEKCHTQTNNSSSLALHNNRLTPQSGVAQEKIMDCLSNSHSSVELINVPVSNLSPMALLPSSIPMPIADRSLPQQRTCRSVGSYSDCEDDFKDITDHCYSNSDSNITNQSFPN